MKKKMLALSAAVACTIAVVFLVPVENVDAVGCYRCLPGGITDPAWGMGSTCAAATNDAINNASNLIPYWCAECGTTVNSLEPCNTSCTNPGQCYDAEHDMWRVDVSLTYRCNEYICP